MSSIEQTIRKVIGGGLTASNTVARQLKNPWRKHPFLTGIHEPIREEFSLTDLKVDGVVPESLSGCYARIGPNPFRPDPRGHHWFLGDGMVHGIRLSAGRAEWYHNRYVRSRALEGVGGPPAAPGPRSGPGDTVNTNVLRLGGRILALVEAGTPPVELNEALDTVAYTNFEGVLTSPFTAHPHEDPLTGEWHAITYSPLTPDHIFHVAIDREGEILRQLEVPVSDGPSIHECALTERFVIIFDLPVTLSLGALAKGFKFPYRWKSERPARIGLLPRSGTADEVIWCEIDPCWIFHVANSFEADDNTVVIDAAAYETMFAHGPDGPNGQPIGLERWQIDLNTQRVTRRTLDATPQEFPRVDERFFGQPYQHSWTVTLPSSPTSNFAEPNSLFHHDLQTNQRHEYQFGPDHMGGEFVFVPRADDAPEGEGWLLGYVVNTQSETTELRILNAQAVADGPVACIHIPHRIPPGFHGNWIADR
jgi:carotenoid cleavage dioxygenase